MDSEATELKHRRSSKANMRHSVLAWTIGSTVYNTPMKILAKNVKLVSNKAFRPNNKYRGQRDMLKIPWGFNRQNPESGKFYRICLSCLATLSDSVTWDLLLLPSQESGWIHSFGELAFLTTSAHNHVFLLISISLSLFHTIHYCFIVFLRPSLY